MPKIKYKLADVPHEVVKQSFTPYKKDYTLDEHNNILVESGTLTDVAALIQSAEESTFDKALSRLLPPEVLTSEQKNVATLRTMQNDLADLGAALELAENYRDKYKLSDELSALEIFKHVTSQSEALKSKINEHKIKADSAAKDSQIAALKEKLNSAQSK